LNGTFVDNQISQDGKEIRRLAEQNNIYCFVSHAFHKRRFSLILYGGESTKIDGTRGALVGATRCFKKM
jgi:hypothetical protein